VPLDHGDAVLGRREVSDEYVDGVTTWLPDPSHYPAQMTPLSATVWFEATGRGLHAAMRELRGPFGGFAARTELGWAYEGNLRVDWDVEPAVMLAAALSIGSTWDATIRPRVHAITAELHRTRLDLGAPAAAAAAFDCAWALILEQWTLHFLAVIPAQFAIEELTDRYVANFGDSDPLAVYRLLDGQSNESVTADDELARLAALAVDLGIDDILRSFPADRVIDRLRQTHPGRRWLHALDAYLLRFGSRSRWHELSLPREVEVPSLTISSIRLFLDRGAPRARPGSSEQSAPDAALASAPDVLEILDDVRIAYGLKENHVYHIDYPGLLATRELLLSAGVRLLAQGTLAEPDDLWMLTRTELRALILDDSAIDVAATVSRRRGELAAGLAEGPRSHLGSAPVGGDEHAVLAKFYGSATGDGQSLVHGSGASPGIGEGPARLVATPDDFARVQPGDVLFALTTTPAWTPLFPSLAALVTETGGVLCHAAIVAREYGIPAVVGAPAAMQSVTDGAMVRVDGTTGSVELL
jgi:rifampicin phosphotransferase